MDDSTTNSNGALLTNSTETTNNHTLNDSSDSTQSLPNGSTPNSNSTATTTTTNTGSIINQNADSTRSQSNGPTAIVTNIPLPHNNNNNNNNSTNNNNQQQQTIIHVRDRLFHALFYRIAIMYARKFPKTFRRLLEFFVLLLALGSFGLLSYLHVVFNRNPINCLAPIQDKWPREGILRVEIVHNSSSFYLMSHDAANNHSYSLKDSYEKEYSNSMLDLFSSYLNADESNGFETVNAEILEEDFSLDPQGHSDWLDLANYFKKCSRPKKISLVPVVAAHTESSSNPSQLSDIELELIRKESLPKTASIESLSPAYKLIKEAFNELQLFSKVFEDNYIIEYSLEYGFLRLSPQTRQKLNITVMLVTLDPNRDECFGTGFNKFVLDEFLGYNEILMLSIKNIAEKEKNKGFVRNAVTGEHFRFVSSWMARSSYVAALLIMIYLLFRFQYCSDTRIIRYFCLLLICYK